MCATCVMKDFERLMRSSVPLMFECVAVVRQELGLSDLDSLELVNKCRVFAYDYPGHHLIVDVHQLRDVVFEMCKGGDTC